MREGPDISQIGALIGDPARANILVALMDGRALTATELAEIAGVTAQTASTHLSRLEAGGLIRPQKQGRHKYFSLAGPRVGQLIESLSETFDPESYHDDYRDQVLALIDKKAAGEDIVAEITPAPSADKVIDLMAALEASVAAAKQSLSRGPKGRG